jgi:hypothetical protein
MRNLRKPFLASLFLAALAALLVSARTAQGYIEAPHTLGRCCAEATNVVLVEIAKLDKTKNLIIFKKVEDLKGTHPETQIKHNIGQRGFNAREWQTVMAWAEVGKKAVFFHNGGASETCIGTYWYQCYKEGDWWGMSHAEPYLRRTYYGDAEKLAPAVKAIVGGTEVVVPCLADASKEQLAQGKSKLQRLKAGLRRIDYNVKRDFVGWGGDDGVTYDTIALLPQSTSGWRYLPLKAASGLGERWRQLDFDDRDWRTGKTPVGYGEEEIGKRGGTTIAEKGTPFLFRRAFDVSEDLLAKKGVTFQLSVASDDSAVLFLNGQPLEQDPAADHEFAYWNHEITLQPKQLRAGRNMIVALVTNKQASSDLYFDLELSAQIPVVKTAAKTPAAKEGAAGAKLVGAKSPAKQPATKEPAVPKSRITVDRPNRTITLTCTVAPRKLAHLKEIYPIEVVATTPQGQKAHETIVLFSGIKASDVQRAVEQLGLKPGKPAKGDEVPQGPEVKISLEIGAPGARPRRLPIESLLVDRKTGRPMTSPLKWYFTGSVMRQPDPEKDDKVPGADVTGTLITLFPVTDDTIFQSSLTMKDEAVLKLETNKNVLPKEGTPATLVIEAAR